MSLISYTKGDLFKLTTTIPNSQNQLKPIILTHACNCHGSWSGGIAYIFKKHFYSSYKLYKKYCSESNPSDLLGTSLIIPVSYKDQGFVNGIGENILIVCLFTANFDGETCDEISQNTKLAMIDLKKKLENPDIIENEVVRKILKNKNNTQDFLINMPKINSGIFGVPWKFTETALKKSGLNCNIFEL